jgi:hypothetical protein
MEDDTIKLLRECNAGVKMGIQSLEDVMEHVKDKQLKAILKESHNTHCRLGSDTHRYLEEYHDQGKEPAAMARMMSWVKSNVSLEGENPDKKAAAMITDGCNMGIKSLYKYMNQYPAASHDAISIAKELIDAEETLVRDMHDYL